MRNKSAKKIVRRILILVPVYIIFFLSLCVVQFSIKGGFHRSVGSLELSGHYKQDDTPDAALQNNNSDNPENDEYLLQGDVSASFGGLVFQISDSNGLALIENDGTSVPLSPVSMSINENSARFKLSQNTEIVFYIRFDDDVEELLISGIFGTDNSSAAGLEIPYTLANSSKQKESERGNIIIIQNGFDYSFDQPVVNQTSRKITLSDRYPVVTYKIIPENPVFNPIDYIITGGMEVTQYNDIVRSWTLKVFNYWQQIIQNGVNDERLVSAYVGEAARHDAYSAAVSAVPSSFRSSASRTYISAPFLGRMDMALRSLSDNEKNYENKITRVLRENPIELLKEKHIIEYLAIRGLDTLLDESLNYLKTITIDDIGIESWPAMLELWRDCFIWKSDIENPLSKITNDITALIPLNLEKDSENRHVFLSVEDTVDINLNISAGAALMLYGEFSERSDWAAIGRSIILSVLSISDDAGSAPENLIMPANGTISIPPDTETISAAELYILLSPSQFFPHAATVLSSNLSNQNIWLWTVSPAVSASFENNILDIDVNFLLGETHYLIIRGIEPFFKIQLRGMDYRSDPQFESYNAPGWAYSTTESTLLVKLVHRQENEKIRIFY